MRLSPAQAAAAPRYETERTIRQQVMESLQSKRVAAADGKGEFNPAELESPAYRKWIQDRIDAARRDGRLLTDQQYADLMVHRELRVDDRVRYVGPERLETSPATGKQVLRPFGQTGLIIKVEFGAGRKIYTFLPHIPQNVRDAAAAGLDVEVLQLVTRAWQELERLVG